MHKTNAIVAVAALAAVAMAPPAQAVTAHSWLDVAAGFDFGMGLGLYDPGTPAGSGPAVYCLALLSAYQGFSPVLLYHMALRYWLPATGVGPVQVDLYVPAPGGCAGLVPNTHVALDSFQFDAGGAFWSNNLLSITGVALLGTGSIWVNYCTAPTANPGANAVDVVPGTLGAFSAETLNCGGAAGTHTLFPGCSLLPASTVGGGFNLDNPVFNYNGGGCNTLQGAPAGVDYAVQHCVSVSVFDVMLGTEDSGTDEDHFVVFGNGGLLGWATTLGAPAHLFPNVSNFQENVSNC